jgi:hypothetical protein
MSLPVGAVSAGNTTQPGTLDFFLIQEIGAIHKANPRKVKAVQLNLQAR